MELQQHIYICDECHEVLVINLQEGIYDDPVIIMPEGWHYIYNHRDKIKNLDLVCPTCSLKHPKFDWFNMP